MKETLRVDSKRIALRVFFVFFSIILITENSFASGLQFRRRSPLTTKGDLYTFGTADARLGVGSMGQILSVDTGSPNGIRWADAPAGTVSNSGTLTSNAVILGAGTTVVKATTADTATVGHFLASTATLPVMRQILTSDVNGVRSIADGGTGGSTAAMARVALAVASRDATYLVQTGDGYLSNEQALSSLSTGIMTVTTATGVVSSVNTSSGLAGQISDETGSGGLVFATQPTLVTPIIGDLGSIADPAGKSYVSFDQVASAVNHIIISNDITGRMPTISSGGSDANIGLRLASKGTGTISFDHAMVEPIIDLTDASTVATDASLGNIFRVTLGGNRTLGTPTNPQPGQKAIWIFSQDATGTRTLAFSPVFRFGTTVTSPTISTTAGRQDMMGGIYQVRGNRSSWDVLAYTAGYSH